MNLVEHILKKQNKYIIKIDNNKLICISTSGIYLIKILEYIGRRRRGRKYFILKDEGVCEIPNFFLELDKVEENLKLKSHVKKIIVKKGICMLEVPYSKEYKVFNIHQLYFKFQKMNREK